MLVDACMFCQRLIQDYELRDIFRRGPKDGEKFDCPNCNRRLVIEREDGEELYDAGFDSGYDSEEDLT